MVKGPWMAVLPRDTFSVIIMCLRSSRPICDSWWGWAGWGGETSHQRLCDSEMALDASVRSALAPSLGGGPAVTQCLRKGNKLSLSFSSLPNFPLGGLVS